MDVAPEELQFLTLTDVLRESIRIPKQASRPFSLVTLTLIFPLSFAILAHSLFTHPLLNQIQSESPSNPNLHHELSLLFIYQFLYLIFLFVFSLLSTAAVVFTVASLYAAKPVSFAATAAAVPRAFYRLFITFLFVSLLMILYNVVFVAALASLIFAVDTHNTVLFFISVVTICVLFLVVHVYITALWHLASVVSVLEPVYGLAAMRKSRELLRGKVRMAAVLVLMYLTACGAVEVVFGAVVVRGSGGFGVVGRVLIGGVMVGLLVIVNLVGLLVQSVFYYVCKSYHHEGIDKSALYEHLGGYLGEYVPLKSSVQMESFEV